MRFTESAMLAMMADLIATGGTLDPAALWVAVATAIAEDGGDTLMADVTPPPGAVATRVPVVAWVGPYLMNDGRVAVDAPIARFTPASAAEACILTHWLLADALVAGGLVGFGILPDPINLVDQLSKASVIVRVTLDPLGRWDATLAYNG